MSWENNTSHAIPFIIKDQHDSYALTPQAEQFLMKIEGPLSIISVAGLYRTGKSYLLNRVILNRSTGFGVGPSVNPCTKGLWLWAEAIRAPEGRTLLVVDTEGLGALDEQSNHDMKIFSLAVLLSTNFVYNSVGSIDETALQTLSLALQLINTIDKQNYSSRPSLLWVVRDFSLQLINDNGQELSSSQYLEMALSTQHLKETQKVQLRTIINQAFSQRNCFTLIKPLIDEQKLQCLDKIPPEQLRPQFVSQTIALRKHILTSLGEMKLNNSGPLNGREYTIMVKKYIGAINSGQVPNLMDTWSFIRTQKARNAVFIIRDSYKEKLRIRLGSKLPMPSAKLTQFLSLLRKQATEQFIKDSYEESSSEQLLQFLNVCENQMLKMNTKESKKILNDLLRKQFQPFQKKLLSDYYSDIATCENDLRQAFTKTFPEKLEDKIDISTTQLDLFTERRVTEASKIFQRKAREESTKARQLKSQAESALQNQLRNITKIADDQRKKYQEQLLSIERKVMNLTSEKDKLQQSLEKQRKDDAKEAEKYRKRAEQNQLMLQNLQLELKRISSSSTEQQKLLFSLKKQLEKEKALSSQKQQYLTNKLNEQTKRIQQITEEYEHSQKIWQNQKRQLHSTTQNTFKNLSQQNKEFSDQIQELAHQVEQMKEIKKRQEEQICQLKQRHQEDIQHYKQKILSSNKKDNKKEDEELMIRINELSEQMIKGQRQVKDWENKFKIQGQELKMGSSKFQKQLAIYTQKIEFQQIQISDLRVKNKELNESYQKYLENVHANNQNVEDKYSSKINQITQEHSRNLAILQEQSDKKFKHVKKQLNLVSKSKEDIELQLSMQKKKAIDRQNELSQRLKRTQLAHQQMLMKVDSMETNQSSTLKQKQLFYQSKIRQLETQLEFKTERTASELEQYTRNSQKNIEVLKNYADMERHQWQKRLQEEKQKSHRKIKQSNDEWTKRLAEEREHLEYSIQQLTDKLQDTENQANQRLQTMKADFEIKMQKMGNNSIQERMDLNKRIALLSQESEMTKSNLSNQLQQRKRTYESHLETTKRQMHKQFKEQLGRISDDLQQSEKQNDSLKKAYNKAKQSNLLLMSQRDKDKAIYKQKIQNLIKERSQLEDRYISETSSQNKTIEELNRQRNTEVKKLNNEIERFMHKISELQNGSMKEYNNFEEEKKALTTKISYLQSKVTRNKEDYDDLLKKFETTVKTLSKNNKHEFEREIEQRAEKMKEEYSRKFQQKDERYCQQKQQNDEKNIRLQTENKTLRDKVLLLQMRENTKKNKVQDAEKKMVQQRAQFQQKLNNLTLQKERYAAAYMSRKRQAQDSSVIKLDRSKISDRSQRYSIIDNVSIQGGGTNKGYKENKSMINCRPSATSIRKLDPKPERPQKKYVNMDQFSGIMRWPKN